jgi:hypothetical protein
MSEPVDLPRLPEERMAQSPRKLSEVKPGEQITLSLLWNIQVDEQGYVWVDISSDLQQHPLIPGWTLRAARTERGFVLWLDDKVKFSRGRRYAGRQYLPVVEFREGRNKIDGT